MVDSVALQWKGLVIPKPGEASDEDGERNIDDWDDLLSLIGSNFASDIRQQIVDQLGYTTSAGIGRVKTLAKLASGFKKPNRQTIVRNDAVGPFLKNFKLTDFWSMGGKNGEAIMAKLDVPYSSQGDEIGYIRNHFELKDLYLLFPDDRELASRLYKIIRGELADELQPKIDLKSMGSNKNFRGNSVSSSKDLLPWFEVYVGDLLLRIQELDEENQTRKRPTKLGITFRNKALEIHSKQCTLVPIKDIEELRKKLLQLCADLLKGLEESWTGSRMYPSTNCGINIGSFKDVDGFNSLDDLAKNIRKKKRNIHDGIEHGTEINKATTNFKINNNELFESNYVSRKSESTQLQPVKRSKVKNDIISSLGNMKRLSSSPSPSLVIDPESTLVMAAESSFEADIRSSNSYADAIKDNSDIKTQDSTATDATLQSTADEFLCEKCGAKLPLSDKVEHQDYHLALSLDSKFKSTEKMSYGERLLMNRKPNNSKTRKTKSKVNANNKGQSRLPF
ncbi:unnamed protein product [Ambrosiozyma monospora]|uniref:Unnamed protein product n=1 Tax=Ambrosiozyma monospora TaxID=43982 RepID=A0ACB5SY97_AMBMO|nr:unnamed protein product [Ambrosiozyma monospora]